MHNLHYFIQLLIHLDQNLIALVAHYGLWAYAILFLIIFCETGLVVTPFLPGDSLLFAAGTLTAASTGFINIHLLFLLLIFSSIAGNALNYGLGRYLGPRVVRFLGERARNPQYLQMAQHFYHQHGGKALVIGRFLPIIRTFAPFVAGLTSMQLRQFFLYTVVGGTLWVGSLLYGSYLFGSLPFIKEHFSTVILAIIVLSLMPPLLSYFRYLPAK